MRIQTALRQVRPRTENTISHIDKIQSLIAEDIDLPTDVLDGFEVTQTDKSERATVQIRVSSEDRDTDRDEILKILHLNNILARPVWEPLNKLSMYKNSFAYNLINTQKLADRIVCLPSSAI